jgi:trans-aconitate methyltransferase
MKESTSYSWDANDYAKQSTNQQKWARELITKLNLQGDEHILDIGCGDGKVTAEIAMNVPDGKVVGMDSSSSMIELAQNEFPQEKYENLSFKTGDARKFSFNERFDLIFSNATLHWVIDHQPVLKNIYNCLKPGGRILLQMGGKGNAANILDVLDDMKQDQKWKSYFIDFDFPYGFHGVEEYKSWLIEAGFIIKCVDLLPKVMTHPDKGGLEGWIRTTWLPYTQRIPDSDREAFISELADRYIQKQFTDSKSHIKINMMRLEVEAEKPQG